MIWGLFWSIMNQFDGNLISKWYYIDRLPLCLGGESRSFHGGVKSRTWPDLWRAPSCKIHCSLLIVSSHRSLIGAKHQMLSLSRYTYLHLHTVRQCRYLTLPVLHNWFLFLALSFSGSPVASFCTTQAKSYLPWLSIPSPESTSSWLKFHAWTAHNASFESGD